MTFTHLTYRILLAFAPLVLLTGCADDLVAIQGPAQDAPDSEPGVWVSLQLSVPRSTRSNPTNGQWGDGSEPGMPNENGIETLDIFFFKDEDKKGLDSTEDPELYGHRHVTREELYGPASAQTSTDDPYKYADDPYKYADKEYTYMYKITGEYLPEENDFIVVIANYAGNSSNESESPSDGNAHRRAAFSMTCFSLTEGKMRGESPEETDTDLSSITNLSGLVDLCQSGRSWSNGAGESKSITDNWNFLMSNAYNTQYDEKYPDDKDKRVNRVIIPDPKGGYEPGDYYNPFNARVYLQRAAARIDLLHDKKNEKKSTEDFINEGNLRYDVRDSKGAIVELTHIQPVNVRENGTYVFKHLTSDLNVSTVESTPIQICANETPENSNDIPSTYVVDKTFFDKSKADYGNTAGTDVVDKGDSGFKLDNAVGKYIGAHKPLSATSDGHDYATILTYAEENTMPCNIVNPEEYATGLLLRAIYHPETVYKEYTHKELSKNDSFENHLYAPTEEEPYLWRYMPNLVDTSLMRSDDLTDTNAIYFSNYDAAKAYSDDHPEEAGTITKFYHGICYYNVWIRHANADDYRYDRPLPMEFGIVRNNLYRLAFTFSGPGTPDVELREPYNVQPRIFVRPWLVREHPEIIL